MSATKIVTYGDIITLPSVTDARTGKVIRWRVDDVRNFREAGEQFFDLAHLKALDAEGDARLSTAHHVSVGGFHFAVEQLGVVCRWSSTKTNVFPHGQVSSEIYETVVQDLSEYTFDLPHLDPPRVRERVIQEAASSGASAARSIPRPVWKNKSPGVKEMLTPDGKREVLEATALAFRKEIAAQLGIES